MENNLSIYLVLFFLGGKGGIKKEYTNLNIYNKLRHLIFYKTYVESHKSSNSTAETLIISIKHCRI